MDADRSRDLAEPRRSCAAALLHTPDGRYLMQHRDDFPDIPFPAHWCCFGGGIEAGEGAVAALRRELHEEIGYSPRSARLFTEFTVLLPTPEPRLERVIFFAVPFRAGDLVGLRQREGAGLALLRPEEVARQEQVVPWDLAALLMHARRPALFGQGRGKR